MRQAVIPTLYSQLVLRIPTIWSQLNDVEELLASAGEVLQYTKSLRIAPKVSQSEDIYSDLELDISTIRMEKPCNGINFPNVLTDITINCLARILLGRLPKGRLSEFAYVFP